MSALVSASQYVALAQPFLIKDKGPHTKALGKPLASAQSQKHAMLVAMVVHVGSYGST